MLINYLGTNHIEMMKLLASLQLLIAGALFFRFVIARLGREGLPASALSPRPPAPPEPYDLMSNRAPNLVTARPSETMSWIAMHGLRLFVLTVIGTFLLYTFVDDLFRPFCSGHPRLCWIWLKGSLVVGHWALGLYILAALIGLVLRVPRPLHLRHRRLLYTYFGLALGAFILAPGGWDTVRASHCEQVPGGNHSAATGQGSPPAQAQRTPASRAPFRPGDRVYVVAQGWEIPPHASGYCGVLTALPGARGTVAAVGPAPAKDGTASEPQHPILVKWDAQNFQDISLEGLLTDKRPFLRGFHSEMPHSFLARLRG